VPTSVRVSAAAWSVAAVVALVVGVAALLGRQDRRRALTALAEQLRPDGNPDVVTRLTAAVLYGGVGLFMASAVAALLLVPALRSGRRGARWWLAVTGTLGAAVAAALLDVLVGRSRPAVGTVALLTAAALALVGLVAAFWPATGRWLRRLHPRTPGD